MKVAIYCRVSTDEQAKHGLSIDTQLFNLREWAQTHGHIIVGEYIDAGVSGKKSPSKRPALSRFLNDIEHGLSVDVLLFTKLDRFTRSVKNYYLVVETLNRHNVAWQAIHEDYETLTAGGRMKVNIMLSVAENEADRTSERIKVVFDRKIANGECINPNGLPLGYTVKDKHVVPDENADAVRSAFEHYALSSSVHATMDFLKDECGVTVSYKGVRNMLCNSLYIGVYKGNTTFCEPIVPKELFDRVQSNIQQRSVRHNPSRRTYLFSGIIYCTCCQHHMIGAYTSNVNAQSYRCQMAFLNHACVNRHYISEKKMERYLLEHLTPELDSLIAEQTDVSYKPKQKQRKKEPVNIQAKLDRLKDLYVDGLIDKEQYLADRTRLLATVSQPVDEPTQPDYSALREIIGKDFATRYGALNAQSKQALWRGLLERIEVDADKNVRFVFRP